MLKVFHNSKNSFPLSKDQLVEAILISQHNNQNRIKNHHALMMNLNIHKKRLHIQKTKT
jgi:hypothetical protein